MVQDIADDDWLLRPDLVPAFEALVAHDLVFDALVLPASSDAPRWRWRAATPISRSSSTTARSPPSASAGSSPGRATSRVLRARRSRVQALRPRDRSARRSGRADDLRAYVDHALACFGPRRLLWGSDWPVVDLAGGYDRWRAASDALLAGLAGGERAAVLGGNATLVYTGGGCIASR